MIFFLSPNAEAFRNFQSNSIKNYCSYGQLTWEWKLGARSYLYPAVFSVIYRILNILKLDSVVALTYAPRIFQTFLSVYADYRFYQWNNRKKWSLFIILSSWFWFYTSSRTIINSAEAALTAIALSMFPWSLNDGKF